ncbi:Tannase/feruloyl esterase [Aspergillus karnatakaensis]|uniref:Tannase/feruloyl esterase n=1 Tax=Aspergillus karnatakaensis TaxID=1810916 RepID=UPI003CCDF8AC
MSSMSSSHCSPNYPSPILCHLLAAPNITGAEILFHSGVEVTNYTLPSGNPTSFCNVTVSVTHPGADDIVYSTILLPSPPSRWNTRYLATGGGGFAAGSGDRDLLEPVSQGWVASSTDGGLTLNNTLDPQTGAWAIRPNGSYNEDLVINLVYRSIHDTAELSKALINQFYGQELSHSYYSGCSAGGRQGYASAANYPSDFDGILATAPALGAPEFVVAAYWPAIVMRETETPPYCVFEAYKAAILEHCDPLDGVADGLISDPDLLASCAFDTSVLVGEEIPCSQLGAQSSTVITSAHAEIVRRILEGPVTPEGKKLWHGLAPGVSFSGAASTTTLANGTSVIVPFRHSEPWIKYLTYRDQSYDPTTIDYETFLETFNLSVSRMSSLYGNSVLNLTNFARGGGKLLTWYGLADDAIPPLGMVDFRHQVERDLGGEEAVNEWYRLFFAPGVAHCRGGYGPSPVDPLKALVDWVEGGEAPETLFARGVNDGEDITRDLCVFPKRLVYAGGDVREASSFVCG